VKTFNLIIEGFFLLFFY